MRNDTTQVWQKQSYHDVFRAHQGYACFKWTQYPFIYDQIFARYLDAGKPVRMLEIGVLNGGSLEVWKKSLPPGSEVHGLDIDPKCQALEFSAGIHFHLGNATDDALMNRLFAGMEFDIILDDGSHECTDVISTFLNLFAKVRPGGIYIVEDLHTSYMDTWGYGLLYKSSSVEFFKRFIDVLHGDYLSREQFMQAKDFLPLMTRFHWEIAGISFYDSICSVTRFAQRKKDSFKMVMSGDIFKVMPAENFAPEMLVKNIGEALETARSMYATAGGIEADREGIATDEPPPAPKIEATSRYDYEIAPEYFGAAPAADTPPPKVSVILTSYNHEKFLDEAIQSTLAQTYGNFELIIWDDASTDHSWSIIRQYSDPRIRAFRNKTNRYLTYNVNKAVMEVARGEYIAMHHSDDVWEPEKLEKQVAFLDRNPGIAAVFSWANIIDPDGNPVNDTASHMIQMFKQKNKTRHKWLRHFFFHGNALCDPSALIRRQCCLDYGMYNLALWQLPDFDLWVRLCFKHEIHVLPEYLTKPRWSPHGANVSSLSCQSVDRTHFEHYMIFEHYRQIASIEEFLKIFPGSKKYCAHPDADLEFALAMTAVEFGSWCYLRLFGLELLLKMMASPERAEKLRTVHHFDFANLTELSGEMQIFETRVQTFSPHQSAAPQKTVPPLEQGIEAFNRKDHKAAIECFSVAMEQEPENPLPCAYLAFICAQHGLVQEARDFIAQTEKIAPDRADLIAALGECFLKNKMPAEAAEYLREAIHKQPDLFAAYPALAQSLHLTGQSAEAIALLQAVASIPSDVQANIQETLRQICAESSA